MVILAMRHSIHHWSHVMHCRKDLNQGDADIRWFSAEALAAEASGADRRPRAPAPAIP
jgi:hypothetical protein